MAIHSEASGFDGRVGCRDREGSSRGSEVLFYFVLSEMFVTIQYAATLLYKIKRRIVEDLPDNRWQATPKPGRSPTPEKIQEKLSISF